MRVGSGELARERYRLERGTIYCRRAKGSRSTLHSLKRAADRSGKSLDGRDIRSIQTLIAFEVFARSYDWPRSEQGVFCGQQFSASVKPPNLRGARARAGRRTDLSSRRKDLGRYFSRFVPVRRTIRGDPPYSAARVRNIGPIARIGGAREDVAPFARRRRRR